MIVKKNLNQLFLNFVVSYLQIRVVNAFQMDLDTSHLDSYDKRSRPSLISLQSLQQKTGVSKKPMLASSPEVEESRSSPWLGHQDSIPYADE